ncbi:MAG: quinone-dependent dihydroorotate dehydrogenase [Cyclobacteriaceae bacterium]|nr:quinone-dependent dihydroorotate dehydrogenase [Cyclobacteriaceae bacterium]MDW8332410.1 quinone-dependent dihydroorotate dehydrogenase [Cyclobacteriaceae bacterium]
MYHLLIRPLLFLLPPETAHHVTLMALKALCSLPFGRSLLTALFSVDDTKLKKRILGLEFPNPVGLAAGFDKDAKYVDELACLGFGFIEIGTVTPLPQPGNEKPRLFRLSKDKALINRLGFNNAGVAEAARRLKKRKTSIIIGGNIGKNKNTPNEEALRDYIICVDALYEYVDYFVLNVSSPNTPGLRELQDKEPLRILLKGVKQQLQNKPVYKPMLLKIAPDLTDSQLEDIVFILRDTQTDGVIATNTTILRQGLNTSEKRVAQCGPGGLSGKPLRERSNQVIRFLRQRLGPDYPIIGVGGIMTPDDAVEKLKAGADLIQIYTGFVYGGPGFVKTILKRLF